MQAVETLVRVYVPVRMDRLHHAFLGAAMARRTAFLVAPEPFEDPQLAGDRERRAERAEIAAEEALDEEADRQQQAGIEHERPFPRETQDHRRLERLDLRHLLGEAQRVEGQPEQGDEDDVFHGPEALVQAPRHR